MIATYLRIGHRDADSLRERRVKSVFALVMIGASLYSLQLIAFEARSVIELAVDGVALLSTLGALLVLQLSKRVDLAYIFLSGLALLALLGVLLVIGNRDGDLFFLILFPIFAVALLGAERSLPWFVVTMAIVLLAGLGASLLPDWTLAIHRSDGNPQGLLFHDPTSEPITRRELIAFLAALTMSYALTFSAYRAVNEANERIEGLLLNILPPKIAARLTDATQHRLREQGTGIADEFDEATILFADIVGFTDLAARTSPAALIRILDDVFTEFDHLAETHQVEKIKTIGDAYMAVCGLPEPNPDHARNIADMALAMMAAVLRYRDASGLPIRLRIGINSGPVIAGIIGRKKFIYDLWGDAVNTASRMESHGEADRIQVSESAYRALCQDYELQPLGEVQIKGKGPLAAWRLLGRRA